MPAVIKEFLLKQLSNLGLSGLGGWFAKKILMYGGQAIYDFVLDLIRKFKRSSLQKEAMKKYEEVIQKPDASLEEKAKAYADLINSGN